MVTPPYGCIGPGVYSGNPCLNAGNMFCQRCLWEYGRPDSPDFVDLNRRCDNYEDEDLTVRGPYSPHS
jgi:hypothetical protein